MKRLQDSFYDEVHKEVVKRMPKVRAQWEEDMAEARDQAARFARMSNHAIVKKKITSDEYKFLLNLLHPDRHPEDRRERFARGFNIVMRLKDYAEALRWLVCVVVRVRALSATRKETFPAHDDAAKRCLAASWEREGILRVTRAGARPSAFRCTLRLRPRRQWMWGS